jgi:hypothetical protein
MALTPKKFSFNQLTAAAVTQWTVPASTTRELGTMLGCNTDTVERTVTVHLVPNGGSVSAANMILDAEAIPASETVVFSFERGIFCEAGDFLVALASQTLVVNLYSSGWDITAP